MMGSGICANKGDAREANKLRRETMPVRISGARSAMVRRLPHDVGAQHLYVIGSFERRGLRNRLAAHTAPHLSHRIVFMVAHPNEELGGEGVDKADAALQQRRCR